MKRLIIAATLVAAIPSPAVATDVATFLAKAEAAKRNKLKAFFSGDVKHLMGEVSTSMQQLKAERLRAERAGGHGAYCVKGRATLSQDELFGALNAIPAAERSQVQVREALRRGLARKYPCPADRSVAPAG